eukprot:symbB.v1.2.007673.t1/scaffold475.1/size199048/14
MRYAYSADGRRCVRRRGARQRTPATVRRAARAVLLLLCLAAWKPALMPDGTNGEDKAIAGAAQACEEMEESPAVAGPKSHETLPDEVEPLRYDLELTLNPERSSAFTGQVRITLNVTRVTSSIMFNARDLLLESMTLMLPNGVMQHPAEVVKDTTFQRVTLEFEDDLQPGICELRMDYSGEMGKDMAGLYSSRYKGPQGWKTLALTQFEAVDARRMLPCWDEPSRKAVFALSVVIPSALTAVSNMPAASETTLERQKRRIAFLDTPRMSSYLLALAVGRFDTIQAQTVNGTLIRVLTMPGQAAQGEFALSVAARALSYYEDYFGLPFPLPKLDMLAAPDFAAGAMENWGLVIYREVDLLCNETTVGVARKVRIATVVTHELSHMWFGNLVTMEWWDQLWLNEGFANWMQTQAVDVLFPEWHIWEQYVRSFILGLVFLRGFDVHGVHGPDTCGMLQYMKGGTEPDKNLSADCTQCCQGLEVYETCGWCPDKASCEVVHGQDGRRRHSRRRATCDYVTSQNQCWGAGCPATYARYVGKIGAHLKRLNKTAVENSPLVSPYPRYGDAANGTQGMTGLFNLVSGQPLNHSWQGSATQDLIIGAASDWASGTCESKTVAHLMSLEQPHVTFHLGDTYYLGDAEAFRHNVMGESPGEGYRCMHLRANGSRDTGDSGETDAPQPEVVVEWLSQTLNLNNVSDTRGIVIMSHHQPYSDFERAYLGTALQLQKILPKNRTVLWLFGHEHRFALYDKLRLNDTWNCTGSVSHFVSDFYFYPRMVGYGGYRDSPKAPKSKDRPWKLKAWDQRVYQEIPNDDDKNLQALGYNGYFKIVVSGARLTITYIIGKCKDGGYNKTRGGCLTGYNQTHGEEMAKETLEVDLLTGELTQEWLFISDKLNQTPPSQKQNGTSAFHTICQEPGCGSLECKFENTSMD